MSTVLPHVVWCVIGRLRLPPCGQVEKPQMYNFNPRQLAAAVIQSITILANNEAFTNAVTSSPHLNDTLMVLRRVCRCAERDAVVQRTTLGLFQSFVAKLMSTPEAAAAAASAGGGAGAASRRQPVAAPDMYGLDRGCAAEYSRLLAKHVFSKTTAMRVASSGADARRSLELRTHFMPLLRQDRVSRKGRLARIRKCVPPLQTCESTGLTAAATCAACAHVFACVRVCEQRLQAALRRP